MRNPVINEQHVDKFVYKQNIKILNLNAKLIMNYKCKIFGSKVPDVILMYALNYPSIFN